MDLSLVGLGRLQPCEVIFPCCFDSFQPCEETFLVCNDRLLIARGFSNVAKKLSLLISTDTNLAKEFFLVGFDRFQCYEDTFLCWVDRFLFAKRLFLIEKQRSNLAKKLFLVGFDRFQYCEEVFLGWNMLFQPLFNTILFRYSKNISIKYRLLVFAPNLLKPFADKNFCASASFGR